MSGVPLPAQFRPLGQETLRLVLSLGDSAGVKLYLVGGYIRDSLRGHLGREQQSLDYDFAVCGAPAIDFAASVAERLGGHFVLLDLTSDTARVVLAEGVTVDFARCVGADIHTDILRRDFTINALVWDADKPDVIIDAVGGIRDLENGIVRAVSEQAFVDDPLRLLRAYRFAAALDFRIEDETAGMLARHAHLLSNVAAERISYELFKVLETERAGVAFKAMGESGLLEAVFPELAACRAVTANAYHHLGLFDHSVETLSQCEKNFAELPEAAEADLLIEISHSITRLSATKLAGLLHDIGKPQTWVINEEGKHTFIGHDKLGAAMCETVARRLKWSRPTERYISGLVRWHLRPGQLFHQGLPTDKAVHKFYRNIAESCPGLVLLALSDFRATCGPGLQEGRELLEKQLRELLESYYVYVEGQKKTPRLLDGLDVMRLLGVKPGPVIGEILEELAEAQGLHEVVDRRQAEAFVEKLFKEKYRK